MHAHTLGAAGALEGIVSVLALQHGFIPPTINYQESDPECDLDYVTAGSRKANLRNVLSNSFAFGGNNTTVIFGKYPKEARYMNKGQQADSAKRVVVTGIGMVTPLGIGKEEFGRRLFSGETAIAEIKSFDTSLFPSHFGAEVTNFNPRDFISVKNMRRMDKISLMTAASSRLALEDAGVQITQENRDRVGITLGTAFGATDVTVQFAGTLLTEGPASVNPILVPNIVMNAPRAILPSSWDFAASNTTVTHFAVSAETAIAYATAEIRRGTADFILTGGVDILSKFYYESLTRFHALSPQNGGTEVCRPFDKDRNGAIAGEGCGIICLESMESAIARGRKPIAKLKARAWDHHPQHRPAGRKIQTV